MRISDNIMFAVLAFFLTAASATAQTTAEITVPATATGGFGNPNTAYTPMVAAITISQPGTIIIQAAGTWTIGPYSYEKGVGPAGVTSPANTMTCCQDPLQEAAGIGKGYTDGANGALMGAFVPSGTAALSAFQPVDNTKALATFGIAPSALFFVGAYAAFEAPTAGTLYLGCNDSTGSDNSGFLSVTITSTGP